MDARLLAGFPLLLLMAVPTRAEDAPASSVETLQQVYEKAMPDLLQGGIKGFETLVRTAPPEFKAGRHILAHRFQRDFQQSREGRGEPIDWTCLGVKNIGTVYRYSIYACRHTKRPTFWYFGAYQMNGRWLLNGVRWDDDLRRLLDTAAIDGQGRDEGCVKLCDEIVDLLAQGKSEAADAIKKLASVPDDAIHDELVRQWIGSVADAGRPIKCELVHARQVGGLLGEYCYAVQWERGIRFFRFVLYRPAKDWKLLSYAYDGDYETMLGKVVFEPALPSAAPETARSAKPGASPDAPGPLR